jgi:hypothetical protein
MRIKYNLRRKIFKMRNKPFFKLLFVVSLVGMLLYQVAAVFALSGYTEQVGQGEVDWEKGVIRVTGVGAAPEGASKATAPLLAQRAAKADAYRNAAEVIEGVRVCSRTMVSDFTVSSDEIVTGVQGLIKGGQFEKPTYDSENRCEIVLVIPIGGQKGLSMLVSDSAQQTLAANPSPSPLPVAATVTATAAPIPTGPYTGIVIDARNLGVRPALYPQVFDVDGYLLYGQSMVNKEQPEFTTMVAYSRTLDKATAMPRVGNNPLKLTATSVVKASNGETTDVVLNSEASKAFRQATAQGDLLSKASVVLIIN